MFVTRMYRLKWFESIVGLIVGSFFLSIAHAESADRCRAKYGQDIADRYEEVWQACLLDEPIPKSAWNKKQKPPPGNSPLECMGSFGSDVANDNPQLWADCLWGKIELSHQRSKNSNPQPRIVQGAGGSRDTSGAVVIYRSRDNHFRVNGMINGVQVLFIIDTGATSVVVSEEFARKAGLNGGEAITTYTANGPSQSRVTKGNSVSFGSISLGSVAVVVGLRGLDSNEALLGQNVLSKLEMNVKGDSMRLTLSH